MNRDSAPPAVLVVSHTHWDREWYHSAVRFRQRLVPLVDELLCRAPDDPSFLLDGQTIVLEDFLAVRPDARDAVADALRDGRIEAGPWYVLADELIPGGEALVRNLLAGRRTLAQFAGAEPPPVLYSPDAFGHPAALPLLASEFGFPLIIIWRGFGGPRWPEGDAVRWRAPDGSTALLYHLPPDGYEYGSNLPADRDAARARWRAVIETVGPRCRLGVVLLMNGADHHAPQAELPAALAALAAAAAPSVVRQVGLREAAEDLTTRAVGLTLPEVRGELRESFGYTWSLQGTLAVRAELKRRAARLERVLVRDVEPWLALARATRSAPAAPVEHAAWTSLLRCHPHDTLCGCSIDAVARAMAVRLDDGEAEAEELRDRALEALVRHDRDAAAGRRGDWTPAVLVRNRAARTRSGVAELELLDFVRDVPVGPGSAFADPPARTDAGVTLDGGATAYQLLATGERIDRIESPRHYPDADLVRVRQVVAWIPHAPAYGIAPLSIGRGESPAPAGVVRGEVRGGVVVLENDHLRLECRDGVPSLGSRAEPRIVGRLLELEDVGDAGDTYTPSLVEPAVRCDRAAAARLVHAGPLRAELRLEYVLRVPCATARDGRTPEVAELPVAVSCILDAGAEFVRLRIRGDNAARDHRLRIVLDGGAGPGRVIADAAFGPVERMPPEVPPELAMRERPLPTAPLHRYVSVFGERLGATVFSDGLAEHEALVDGRIAITLFRAVGALSRPDLPERPGHAGWPADTPEAQCLGPFECELSLMLHGPRTDAEIDRIERTADDVLLPLTGETHRALLHVPEPVVGPALEGAGLAFGACKRSEDGEWVVLRCVNLLERPVQGAWRLPEPPRAARASRLDERVGDALPVSGDTVTFTAPPRGVVTLLVR
jgi:alpha-mannosidase